jgi:hypothetical protein
MRDLDRSHAIIRGSPEHLAVAAPEPDNKRNRLFVEKPGCTMKLAKIHVRKMQEKLKAKAERKSKNAIAKTPKK